MQTFDIQFPVFFFSSRRRHTRWPRDWSSDVCSSDLEPEGRLELWAGSIAVHILERSFVERLVGEHRLPFHRAIKQVPFLDEAGRSARPEQPNAVKFEQFIFEIGRASCRERGHRWDGC